MSSFQLSASLLAASGMAVPYPGRSGSMSSEDRWTYPSRDDDSKDIDREQTDAETVAAKQAERSVSHPQQPGGQQGTTADSPGVDPSDRHHPDGRGTPTSSRATSGEE